VRLATEFRLTVHWHARSEFERKERLYVEILQLLDRGQAWESALVLTKELQAEYESHVFAYTRLSEILAHQVGVPLLRLRS
jgi:hypothetical protein